MNKPVNKVAVHWLKEVAWNEKLPIIMLLFIQVALGISGVYYAILMRNLIDGAAAKERQVFFLALAALTGLILIQILLRAAARFLEEHTRAAIENQCKRRLFDHLLRTDYATVTETHTGEWMNRLTSDTLVVADGLTQILPGTAGMAVKLAGALLMIWILEPSFGYLLFPGGVLLIFLSYSFRKILKKLHKNVQEADGKVRVFLQENLESMLVVKAFAKETQTLENAAGKMENHKRARMRKNHFSNLSNIGFAGLINGAYILGAAVGGYGILTGTMSYGTMMAILQLIAQVQTPFANITGYLPRYYAMAASAERLMEVESCAREEDAGQKSLAEIQTLYRNGFAGLCLREAGFTYRLPDRETEGTMPVVLSHVNLEIKKGDYVALTGTSGCGKSTLLKLFLCLYPLDAGERQIQMSQNSNRKKTSDKIPLTQEYRSLFAYVPQGNHLMSGSIREIIAFSDEEAMRDEERIWRALSIACGDRFVRELSQGIDTVLGERGAGLSEGQMQRIAIARAICSDHPILMLDESTSALDEKTEKKLLENLRSVTDRTVLIVTHRKAVLDICDKEIRFSKEGVKIWAING